MADIVHLIVEEGDNKGQNVTVPPEGARLGRSSKNDIVLTDPSLSRHHCRLFFKTNNGLWVTDLGSANETLVNGVPIQESRIRVGNTITIGDTVLRVLNDGITPVAPDDQPAPAAAPVIDLGLSSTDTPPARTRLFGTGPLVIIATLVVALALAVWIPRLLKPGPGPKPRPRPRPVDRPTDQPLLVDYEKIRATPENVFRYHLQISRKNLLSIEIDDIENDRHVRKETTVEKDLVQNLSKTIHDAGFFGLKQLYDGYHPRAFDHWDLTIASGPDVHRVAVKNRVQPAPLKTVTERIESFGKTHLGLWAIQFSADKLREMANDAFVLGKKLHAERSVKNGNLAAAIKSFAEAEWYLETVEPKPDFYREILSGKDECKKLLQKKYDDLNFAAERALRLREWENAAQQLRIICESIPDRGDKRHKEARKKLLTAEEQIAAENK